MKKSYLIAITVAVIAVLWVMSGVFAPSSEDASAAAPEKMQEKKVVEVRVRNISAEPITNEVVVTGRTQASRQVELKAETEGQVVEIIAERGTAVTGDQVIARLEEGDRKARVAEAKERIAQRQIEFNAAKELETKGFNSKVRLAQAGADLEAARAELKKAELDLENTEIKAPFEGLIADQSIEIGDYVGVGDMLFNIVDLDPVELNGFVTEHQIQLITLGKKARARFINNQEIEGTVTYIAPAANPQTRTFEIEISLPNPGNKIIDGMTAQIFIPTEERKVHKISPSVLSLNDEGQVGVKLVTNDNKVEFMPIVILADKPDDMLVGGLPEKARIITVGQDFVIPGQIVKPVAAEGDGLL